MNNYCLKKNIKQKCGKNTNNIGCLIAVPVQINPEDSYSPFFVSIGMSVCNTVHDKFDKKIAEQMAKDRANTYWKEYKYKDKHLYFDNSECKSFYLYDEYNKFINRCKRYYKDKNIILPKIEII